MALPLEMWTKICAFACTGRDGCATGHSLSLVSTYMNTATQPVRLHSVRVVGIEQMIEFAAMLERTPANLRGVRRLFMSNVNPRSFPAVNGRVCRTSDGDAIGEAESHVQEWMTMGRKREQPHPQPAPHTLDICETLIRILSSVSQSLETLHIFSAPAGRTFLFPTVTLPRLKSLTLYGPVGGKPVLHGHTSSLKRLHVGGLDTYPDDFFSHIASYAPHITHLRLTGPNDARAFHDLQAAMGREPCPPIPVGDRLIAQLPLSLKRVQIGADIQSSQHFHVRELAVDVMVDCIRDIAKEDERFVVLTRLEHASTIYDEAEREWMGEEIN